MGIEMNTSNDIYKMWIIKQIKWNGIRNKLNGNRFSMNQNTHRHSQRNAFDVKNDEKNSMIWNQFCLPTRWLYTLHCDGWVWALNHMFVSAVFVFSKFCYRWNRKSISVFWAMREKLCGWKFSHLCNGFTLFSHTHFWMLLLLFYFLSIFHRYRKK